jgi:hypothetical protein
MDINEKIDVMGILNSIDKDGILAEADQIEIANYDNGSSVKVPDVVLKCAKGLSADELAAFGTKNSASTTAITGSQLFICTTASSTNTSWLIGHIYYYDATSRKITDITPATGGGSGGSSSAVNLTVNFYTTEATTTAEINIPYIWTSSNTGYGTVYYILDDASAGTKRMVPGSATWNLGTLKRGTHNLSMYVTDSANQASTVWHITIIVGSLEISTSSSLEMTIKYGSQISLPYTVYFPNNDNLVLVTKIDDGSEIEAQIASTVSSGSTLAYDLPSLNDGTHTLTMYLKNTRKTGTVEKSSELVFNIVVAVEGTLYVTPTNPNIEISDYDVLNLTAFVTYLGASSFSAKLTSVVDSTTGVSPSDYVLPSASTWLNGTNTMTISSVPSAGNYTFTINVTYKTKTDSISKSVSYSVKIKESTLKTYSPVTDGILFNLSATGKSNTLEDKDQWVDSSKKLADDAVKLYNFNYKASYDDTTKTESGTGWLSDSNGTNTRLLIQSGAYVEINCQPLANEIEKGQGFTFDIDFSTEDVLDQEARVASCYSEGRGFWINTEYATLSNNLTPTETTVEEKIIPAVVDSNGNLISEAYTQYVRTGPFQANFKQNERTHITFVIAKKTAETDSTTGDLNGKYPISSMIIYVNGVLTNISSIAADGIKFSNTGKKITLGCDNDHAKTGKCEIYHVRAYSRALSSDEVLQNYISDFVPETQDSLINFNSAAESSTSGLPKMTMVFHKADLASLSKENKKMCKIVYMVPGDNLKSFEAMAQCAWQGTSSLTYAVKNYKIKLYKLATETTTTEGGGSTTSLITDTEKLSKQEIDLGNGIAENTFCLKADYMDSSHARNTGTAMFVADLDTPQTPPQQLRPATRSTIYGFPIKLYVQTSESDMYETTGTADYTDPVFYGIFNFNLDKSSNDSLGMVTQADMLSYLSSDTTMESLMNSEYPDWDCISFEGSANSDSTAGAFVVNPDEMTHNASIASDFELRFEDPGKLSNKPSTGLIESGTDANGVSYYKISGINTDVDGYFIADKATNSLVPHTFNPYGSIKPNSDNTGFIVSPTIDAANGRMSFARSDGGTFISSDGTVNIEGVYSSEYAFKGTAKDSDGNYTDSGILTLTISLETNSDGTTYDKVVSNESNQLRIDRRYSHLKKLIRWVNDTTDTATFKKEFTKHFDLDAVLDYYCVVLTLLMADNLGKNVMWNTWGPKAKVKRDIVSTNNTVVTTGYVNPEGYEYTADEMRKYDNYIWYPQFYDMDTELGCDNSGNIRFDVDAEMEKGVFNTSGSLLWTRFKKAFSDEILAHYKKMRTESADHSSLTYNSLCKYYLTNQILKISQSNYNYDMFNKYLNTEEKRGYMFMCHGSQEEFLMRWIEQRLYFLDTYFQIGTDSGVSGTIRVEYNDYATVPVSFAIKTYKPAYVKVVFFNTAADASAAESGTVFKKVPRDATVTFEKYVKTATDQEVLIYDAPNIKTFGDVSRYSPKTVMVSTMTHLTDLSVGSEAYPNPNLTDLTLGNNSFLTSVKAEYCTAMTSTLSLATCNNIQSVSTLGSKIPYVSFNKNGCALSVATFGSSTTMVDIENCPLLKSISFQSMAKLSTLRIINCPKLLGTDMSANKGVFYYNVLNTWKPTNLSTEIYLNGYGELADYSLLDNCANICASLASSYLESKPTATDDDIETYIKSKIYFAGEIDYLGNTIPNKYSVYSKYFPDLLVKYPNVTNVSGMFKNYKNINSISQKIVGTKNSQTGEITYATVYYWTDPRTGEFDASSYDSDGDRLLPYYDYKDMDKVANEIKERIDPFERFTNMDEMFSGDSIIEKILPTTFDHITSITNASTNQMFYNCQRLKYVECPRVSKLGNQMFYNCLDTVIYIPNTITDPSQISGYAFQCDQASVGKHQTVLFEAKESDFMYDATSTTKNVKALDGIHCAVDGVRDARFGIKSYYQGTDAMAHAMLKKTETYVDVLTTADANGDYTQHSTASSDLDFYYFNTSVLSGDKDSDGNYIPYRLIYDIRKKDADESTSVDMIKINNWNVDYNNSSLDYTKNPMHVAEMLRGSMSRVSKTNIFSMAIPTMNTVSLSSNGILEYREEGSIARIFYPTVTTAALTSIGTNETNNHFISESIHILTVPGWNTSISKFFFSGTNVKSVVVDSGLTEIKDSAFEDSGLEQITLTNYDITTGANNLAVIGDAAFKGTKLTSISIPDSVTSIGQYAYQNTLYVTNLKYSNKMTYVPQGCFAGCDSTGAATCTSISGFDPTLITKIDNYAFDKASGLKIVQSTVDATSEELDPPTTAKYSKAKAYHCYFACDPTHSKFLNYFDNLEYVGDYSFRGVTGIKKITIQTKLKTIGAFAFDPAKTGEYDTMLVWQKDGDFSGLKIGRYAFAGRQFCWYCNGYGKMPYEYVIEKTAFVPSTISSIELDAFSCDTDAISSPGELKYMLVDDTSENIFSDTSKTWNTNFVSHNLRTVYNFYCPYILTESSTSATVNTLYFLLKQVGTDYSALYARVLGNAVNINVASYIECPVTAADGTRLNKRFYVTEMIDQALKEDSAINNITFGGLLMMNGANDKGSKLVTLGSELFSQNASILQILAYNPDGSTTIVPKTLTTIGSGTPFKSTSWYKNISYTSGNFSAITENGFVYLNGILLGYKQKDADDKKTSLTLLDKTTVVYDDAFSAESTFQSITLNAGLTKICDRAFTGCTSLSSISFAPCADTLSYIGSEAFKNCTSLKTITFTKALRHVGSGSIYLTGITEIKFEEGCSLDSTSYAICPSVDSNTGLNTTITDLYIPESMGKFFSISAATSTAMEFMKLSNVSNLVLGTTKIVSVPSSSFKSYVSTVNITKPTFDPINDVGYIMDVADTQKSDRGHYFINLRYFYPSYYDSSTKDYDALDVSAGPDESGNITFRTIDESAANPYYASDIDISKILATSLDAYDMFRFIMSFTTSQTTKVNMSKSQWSLIPTSFNKFSGNRISINTTV